MSGGHTPGPWQINGPRKSEVSCDRGYPGSGYVVAVAHGLTHTSMSEAEANARLIAAAPELLEALERLAVLTPFAANAETPHDLHLTVRAIAESAIAKARGEQP